MLHSRMTRRSLLSGAAGLTFASLLPRPGFSVIDFNLIPGPAKVPLVGAQHPDTAVWAYNGLLPGPPLRVKQGDHFRIAVENKLPEDTSVHFHGIRLPNAMDGVPDLTQQPIVPGGTFTYAFDLPDAVARWLSK